MGFDVHRVHRHASRRPTSRPGGAAWTDGLAEAAESEPLVVALALFSFVNLGLAAAAARAHDREDAGVEGSMA